MPDLLDDVDLPPVTSSVTVDLDAMERWSEDCGPVFEWDTDVMRALFAELRAYRSTLNARPSPNGAHGYETTCHGCGAKVTAKRRPVVGRHNWCETCKANGEPAAQRARDYRSRKGEK